MPTIDELAPATAASDTDAFVASQNGISRKLTRAQLVAGLQPQLALAAGTVLGRASAGTGDPEPLSIGANLVVNQGTLSATASPFTIAALPPGVVPDAMSLIPVSQGGTNAAISYLQLLAGLPAIPGLDASSMDVRPTGGTASQSLADFCAAAVLRNGGTMSGPLTLAADPATPMEAATKQYVDSRSAGTSPWSGGTVSGPVGFAAPLSAFSTANFAGQVTMTSAVSCAGTVTAAGIIATGNLIAQTGVAITGGVALLPSYHVASLPAAAPGALAYASDGRKPGEQAGGGSGVLVWGTASNLWLSILSGAPVQA